MTALTAVLVVTTRPMKCTHVSRRAGRDFAWKRLTHWVLEPRAWLREQSAHLHQLTGLGFSKDGIQISGLSRATAPHRGDDPLPISRASQLARLAISLKI